MDPFIFQGLHFSLCPTLSQHTRPCSSILVRTFTPSTNLLTSHKPGSKRSTLPALTAPGIRFLVLRMSQAQKHTHPHTHVPLPHGTNMNVNFLRIRSKPRESCLGSTRGVFNQPTPPRSDRQTPTSLHPLPNVHFLRPSGGKSTKTPKFDKNLGNDVTVVVIQRWSWEKGLRRDPEVSLPCPCSVSRPVVVQFYVQEHPPPHPSLPPSLYLVCLNSLNSSQINPRAISRNLVCIKTPRVHQRESFTENYYFLHFRIFGLKLSQNLDCVSAAASGSAFSFLSALQTSVVEY